MVNRGQPLPVSYTIARDALSKVHTTKNNEQKIKMTKINLTNLLLVLLIGGGLFAFFYCSKERVIMIALSAPCRFSLTGTAR